MEGKFFAVLKLQLRMVELRNSIKKFDRLQENFVGLVEHWIKAFITPELARDLRFHMYLEKFFLEAQFFVIGLHVVPLSDLNQFLDHAFCHDKIPLKIFETSFHQK